VGERGAGQSEAERHGGCHDEIYPRPLHFHLRLDDTLPPNVMMRTGDHVIARRMSPHSSWCRSPAPWPRSRPFSGPWMNH
jgi:hypothetical protein